MCRCSIIRGFLRCFFSSAQQNCAAIPNRVCEFNRQFIYLLLFFFIRELTTKSFARIEENMWRTLDRIIIFSSFMFIRRRIRCNLSSLLSSRKISSTPRSSSFDRRVRNSNWTAVAGTIFNETSVTFAYRDIQFCEAAKNKGSRRRKEAEVAVGGHAIK